MPSFEEQSPKVQIATMALLALVLAGAAEYALLTPMRKANAASQAKLEKVRQDNLNLRPWVGRLTILQTQNKQLERQWHTVESLLPTTESPDIFLHQLDEAARESGVSIRKVGGDKIQDEPLYREAPFSLQIDGSFANVLGFFDRVRALPRIVSIRHWTLKGLRAQGNGPTDYAYRSDETVTATCEVSTFYSPDSNAVAAAATAAPAHHAASGGGAQ